MTRRRILPRLLAVGVLVLALAGCVRFQADIALNPDNVVDGQIIVAVLDTEKTDDSRANALSYVADIESNLLGSLRDAAGVTTTQYDQDDYFGTRIDFDDVPLTAFSGQRPESLRFERDGDFYVFTGALDFTAQSLTPDGDADADNLRVSITFPGEIVEQKNGAVSGATVTWSTALDQRVEMYARGGANPPGAPVLLIVGIVAGVLVVVAAVVAVLLLVRARRAPTAAASAPAEALTAPEPTDSAPESGQDVGAS